MMFMMPENTDENVRTAMETGAFYSSSRYAMTEGVDARAFIRNWEVPAPAITDILIDGNNIKVSGDYYLSIEWIADGITIATGNEIDLEEHKDLINSYIRFQLKGEGGISWAQPMLLKMTEEEVAHEELLSAIDDAKAFLSSDFSIYTKESVEEAKDLVQNVLNALDLPTNGNAKAVLDEVAADLLQALKNANDILILVRDILNDRAYDIKKNGLTAEQLHLSANNRAILTLLLPDLEPIILSTNANNRNVSGELYLGDGYFLIFNIKGNGSNVKVFEVVYKG